MVVDDEVVLDVDNINDDEWERSTTPIQLSPSFCFGDMNLAHDHSDGLPDSTFGDVVFDEVYRNVTYLIESG